MSPLDVSLCAEALAEAGLCAGDTVFVHADLKSFGIGRDADGRLGLRLNAETALQAFWRVLGKTGTIVVPSFTYSWPEPGFFDPDLTPSFLGAFSECVRLQSGAVRSLHPLLSLAACGSRARDILHDDDLSGFGAMSPYARLRQVGARLVQLGVPFCSYKDYIEVTECVPYRYPKFFFGSWQQKSVSRQGSCHHWVRYTDCGVELKNLFDGIDETGRTLFKDAKLGAAAVRMIPVEVLDQHVRARLHADPFFFLEKRLLLTRGMMELARLPQLGIHSVAFSVGGAERWFFWQGPSMTGRSRLKAIAALAHQVTAPDDLPPIDADEVRVTRPDLVRPDLLLLEMAEDFARLAPDADSWWSAISRLTEVGK